LKSLLEFIPILPQFKFSSKVFKTFDFKLKTLRKIERNFLQPTPGLAHSFFQSTPFLTRIGPSRQVTQPTLAQLDPSSSPTSRPMPPPPNPIPAAAAASSTSATL
jgi:hypothetical protein